MSEVELLINDKIFEGWEDVNVVRTLDAMSGGFTIGATDKDGVTIQRGDSCVLRLAGLPIITGYVDTIDESQDDMSHSITVTGRDKSGDLVDCSATNASSEFLNIRLKDLIDRLIKPFNINLIYDTVPDTVIKKVSLQQETVFEVLDRECRRAGIFIYPDGKGNLVIQKFGSKRAVSSLVFGENIKKYSIAIDYTNRYSQYEVKGQTAGYDYYTAQQSSSVYAKATDPNVPRFRPLIIVAESSMTIADAQKRVQWEATVRAAKSVQLQCTVPGWTQEDGSLWDINQIVSISTPKFSGEMLIKQITYRLDEQSGTVSEFVLVNKDSFIPKEQVPKAGKGTGEIFVYKGDS